VLGGLEIDHHFEIIVTSADARIRKPSPAIFNYALDQLALRPEHVRHVGDSPRCDRDGALAAGIRPYLLEPPETGITLFWEEVRAKLRPTENDL
jgi:putative hydrolase of the HAD superfamily